jgi:acetyl esterase
MPLDPEMQAVLDALARGNVPALQTLSIAQARALAAGVALAQGPACRVEVRTAPGPGGPLPLHVYRPIEEPAQSGGLVFFSGGGYVIADVPGHDALCRQLATGAGCVVVSVQHRLAPEHRFPAAVDDAYAATCWVHENADTLGIDHQRVAIGGCFSGATLATVVARLAKERRNPALVFQLLLCPITDLRMLDTPWLVAPVPHALLTPQSLRWFAQAYVRTAADYADPRCSPLAAKNLIGLPAACIVSAEYDPLCSQAEAYAAALCAAHVPVSSLCYPGVVHGFVNMHACVQRGRDALRQCQQALRTALAPRL